MVTVQAKVGEGGVSLLSETFRAHLLTVRRQGSNFTAASSMGCANTSAGLRRLSAAPLAQISFQCQVCAQPGGGLTN